MYLHSGSAMHISGLIRNIIITSLDCQPKQTLDFLYGVFRRIKIGE
jgi:hypothetical protein